MVRCWVHLLFHFWLALAKQDFSLSMYIFKIFFQVLAAKISFFLDECKRLFEKNSFFLLFWANISFLRFCRFKSIQVFSCFGSICFRWIYKNYLEFFLFLNFFYHKLCQWVRLFHWMNIKDILEKRFFCFRFWIVNFSIWDIEKMRFVEWARSLHFVLPWCCGNDGLSYAVTIPWQK